MTEPTVTQADLVERYSDAAFRWQRADNAEDEAIAEAKFIEAKAALNAEIARLTERLRVAEEALRCAPIPGRGEEMMNFRDRQDKWLATKYRAALDAIAQIGGR